MVLRTVRLGILNMLYRIGKLVQNPQISEALKEKKGRLSTAFNIVLYVINKNDIDFKIATLSMKKLKLTVIDLKSFIQSIIDQHSGNKGSTILTSMCSGVIGLFKRLNTVEVIPDVSSPTFVDNNGWKLSFIGNICLYSLCFNNMNLSIENHPDANTEDILITGNFINNQNMSSRISIMAHDKFKFRIKRNENKFSGYFTASVMLFGTYYQTKVFFTDYSYTFVVPVSFGSRLSFKVHSNGDITTASWIDLVTFIQGISIPNVSYLQTLSEKFYLDKSIHTKNRLTKVKQRKKEASLKYLNILHKINDLNKKFEFARENLRLIEEGYRHDLNYLTTSQLQMQSYMQNIEGLFIEKNLSRVCVIKTCNKNCIPMPECEICQDPVSVDVNVMKCKQTEDKIKSTVMVPLKTMRDEIKHFFIPVYTGDCEEDPVMKGYKNQQIKEYMGTVSRASAAGALIGSVIPGIETSIGGVIGG